MIWSLLESDHDNHDFVSTVQICIFAWLINTWLTLTRQANLPQLHDKPRTEVPWAAVCQKLRHTFSRMHLVDKPAGQLRVPEPQTIGPKTYHYALDAAHQSCKSIPVVQNFVELRYASRRLVDSHEDRNKLCAELLWQHLCRKPCSVAWMHNLTNKD